MTVTRGGDEGNRMSLTYSDFPYYLNNQGDQMDTQAMMGALPREFQVIQQSSVPLLQNAEDNYQDFIILAEFSELEGPIPLCTIPSNAPKKTDINLNNFAVHLMSTDYQVNVVGHFKICEDTQVLRKNVFKDVHVFMQYFTLYDIKARGFVRPFCFGYVSKDHVKLDRKLESLISQFDKMTKVLKHANRKWFACELEQYLDKLSKAKESFIQEFHPQGQSKDETIFYFDNQSEDFGAFSHDSDTITLDQIAHQFSEIENIVRTVKAAESPELKSELDELSLILTEHEDSDLISLLKKLQIGYTLNAKQLSIDSLNIPLVHPLKVKGESLRPLTTLGQLGTVNLIWKLLLVYKEHQTDLIFSEMSELSADFLRHCGQFQVEVERAKVALEESTSTLLCETTENKSVNLNGASSSSTQVPIQPVGEISLNNKKCFISAEEDEKVGLIFDPEVTIVFDKVHLCCPMPTDNKSASYHTVSEEESDVPSPPRDESGNERESNGYVSAPGSVESNTILSENIGEDLNLIRNTAANCASTGDVSKGSLSQRVGVSQLLRMSTSSFSSQSEDGISSLLSGTTNSTTSLSSLQESCSEEIILKKSWWDYAAKKLVRGEAGYGILSFFRHYAQIAHHILYSLLLQRPVIVCGNEEQRNKVGRILTALIPFVICANVKSWKLLRWHRGILVSSHLKEFKLIGLCIPERLEVHDLIHLRDQNYVTILNVPKKSILGPAYSGNFLSAFENVVQKNFYNSDVSMLTFIGGIYTEIETKIYMWKSLEEKNGSKSNKRVNYKEIGLKASDIDIVRHLAGLINSPDCSLNIF